jgi:hypothetical protein
MISAVHITSEYLPLLAFEPALGHGGDPARRPAGLRAAGNRFGVIGDRECDHTKRVRTSVTRERVTRQ